ncbi:hypothetical protein [Kribbella sp. NPDC048915]|uniref:hypothetical protein n=1 Tax=Kribbella sp. NPDC048915 TaxID=3155148 RepID=UPI00340ED8A0
MTVDGLRVTLRFADGTMETVELGRPEAAAGEADGEAASVAESVAEGEEVGDGGGTAPGAGAPA